MLDDSDRAEAAHHSHTDQLQADVQPLHGSFAQELAALIQLQALDVLLLKPGTLSRVGGQCLNAFASYQCSNVNSAYIIE